jgi:hypothetical protein
MQREMPSARLRRKLFANVSDLLSTRWGLKVATGIGFVDETKIDVSGVELA